MSEWKETSLGNIPIDWDINSLGELLYIKGRIGWKGLKKSEYLKEGYAIINGEQIINGKVDWKNVGRIPKERYDESPEIMLKSGDILMTKDGTIGKIALIENLPEHATVASGVFVIRKQSPRLKQKYLYYFFKSHYFNYLIKSRTEGSVIPHLYQRDFIEMEIPLPEPNEQENISKLLTKLDNKIDLLRRQNETLEAIAHTLFKRWFVEFEFPDENGLPYKSSGGKMVPSDLGEIPDGWRVIELSELVETITKGTTPTTLGKKFVDKGINFIKAESITSNHTFDKNKFAHIDEQTDQLLNRSKIQQGDFLYTIAGTIGRFAVVTERVLPANTNQAIAIIRLKKNLNISPYQLLCYLKSHFYQTYLRSRIIQAVQANLSLGELKNTPIILAENSVQSKFSKIAKSLFNKIEKNEELIGLLVQTRDILLPKLMSGQIRVK